MTQIKSENHTTFDSGKTHNPDIVFGDYGGCFGYELDELSDLKFRIYKIICEKFGANLPDFRANIESNKNIICTGVFIPESK